MAAKIHPILCIFVFALITGINGHGQPNNATGNILVSFSSGMGTIFNRMERLSHRNSNATERRGLLTRLQKEHMSDCQAKLQSFLTSRGIPFESFWINNKMIVKGVPLETSVAQEIREFLGVSKVEKEPIVEMIGTLSRKSKRSQAPAAAQTTWGIRKIYAEGIWPHTTGLGVGVANIGNYGNLNCKK